MATPTQLFKERAHWLKRDLRNGTITRSELPEYIRGDWDKDEDEYRGSYGVTSYSQFKAGVMAAVGGGEVKAPKRPTTRKAKPSKKSAKAWNAQKPVKKIKAHQIVDAACRNKHLPAWLKRRYC